MVPRFKQGGKETDDAKSDHEQICFACRQSFEGGEMDISNWQLIGPQTYARLEGDEAQLIRSYPCNPDDTLQLALHKMGLTIDFTRLPVVDFDNGKGRWKVGLCAESFKLPVKRVKK